MARLRRLHPDPAELDPEAFLDGIELPRDASDGRPHLIVNMVASVDGRAAVDGRSAPLTGAFDRALFHALRRSADAVLIGPRTLSAERYGPLVRGPERRRARTDRGLSPLPLACIVTRSGQVDFSVPLFDEPEQTVLVFAGRSVDVPDCAADVRIASVSGDELEPGSVVRALRSEHGVGAILCEGGPTLNAALLRAGVVDELFLSVAPTVAGRADPLTIVDGDTGGGISLELVWALEADSMLFLRYGVKSGP
jgi:riboflavin biosynthesis pyrimidine reductase